MTPELVQVTQADREAAAKICVLAELRPLILDGRCDDSPLAQAFARHRIAALEEAARVAEEVRDGFLSPEYATGQPSSSIRERFACNQVIAALRQSKEQGHD